MQNSHHWPFVWTAYLCICFLIFFFAFEHLKIPLNLSLGITMAIEKFLNFHKPIFSHGQNEFCNFSYSLTGSPTFQYCDSFFLTTFFSQSFKALPFSLFTLIVHGEFKLCYCEDPYLRVSFARLNFNPKTSLFCQTSHGISF